ncbi:hypothetical protein ACFLQ1_02790 [Candidatus Auribacterota bacterium]
MGEKKEKKEKPTNCAECNKALQRKSYYYRNGKYYCNMRCFKVAWEKIKKEKKEAEEKAKQEAEPQEAKA